MHQFANLHFRAISAQFSSALAELGIQRNKQSKVNKTWCQTTGFTLYEEQKNSTKITLRCSRRPSHRRRSVSPRSRTAEESRPLRRRPRRPRPQALVPTSMGRGANFRSCPRCVVSTFQDIVFVSGSICMCTGMVKKGGPYVGCPWRDI